MPLAGGATDKIGNRYEGRWTVYCMIDVMDEKADSIRLEPPGQEGEGVEFWLKIGDKREYHQVKRQKSGRGCWTISSLQAQQVQVLSDFWKHLRNADATCVFVSTQDADELAQLAERAREAASWEEFKKEFLNKNLSGKFSTLCQKWNNCSEKNAYESLKRIRVKTVGEEFLLDVIENRLAALVEGDPKTIRLELAEFALEKIHQELTVHDIWHYLLEERKYRRRQWNKDPHVLTAVTEANKRYISLLRDAQQLNKVIPRNETQTFLQKLETTESKPGVLLVGEAGVGKSGVMLQVVETLRKQGTPILAFRVDRLEPTQLPDNVGQQLGLPGSPANILAAIAQKRDCVLIIDQLDAVSLASGRNPLFFECVYAIIKQAQAHPQMRIVLACRKFDFDNDHRLRDLANKDGIEVVTISRLSDETVREVVKNLGLDSRRLTNAQLKLLSIPLHLSLLAEISGDSTIDVLSFSTAKDLYDRFCNRKQQKLRERLAISIQWTKVIDKLCDYMSDRQILSAPQIIVDDWENDAKAMASEHILTSDSKKYSFFHDGFFDYAFARRFAARGQNLLDFLQASEQHLFRRAQVRQILLHEREADFDQYLSDLRELLHSDDIRFHIKQLVLALLASINEPTEEEWEVLVSLKNKTEGIFTENILSVLRNSASWFELVDRLGLVEQGLKSQQEEEIDATVFLICTMQQKFPDRVAELVEPFVVVSEKWNARFLRLLSWSKFNNSRRFFDLFLCSIDSGVLDDVLKNQNDGERDFWFIIHELPQKNPDWACEAIGFYLNRRLDLLDLTIASGQANPFDRNYNFIPYSSYYEETLLKSSKNNPKSFIYYILPVMLRVMELTAKQESEPPWYDLVWRWRSYGKGLGIEDRLLSQMEAALSNLAANHPEDFANITHQQIRYSNFETIKYLLIRVYTANGKRFADEAIDYLCEQPVRLETGYCTGQGNIHAAPYWATRELLEAITPYCTDENLLKLERTLLNYYPDREKTVAALKLRGYPQLVLLDAITPSRRSLTVNRRIQEWQRKFITFELVDRSGKIKQLKAMEASCVGSPVSSDAIDKMSDRQWLSAISHYNRSGFDSWFQHNDRIVGGAHQLSILLEKQVQKQPERFSSLLAKFPNEANTSYFDAILRGLAEADIDVETAFQVCQRCHQLLQHPCGNSISWLIRKKAELSWHEEAFKLLLYYALEDPDPDRELWRTDVGNGQVYYGGSILNAGINSVRGSVVSTIAKLIFADKNRAAYFQEPLQQIVKDSSIAVRACAAEALMAMLNYTRDLAVKLFLELCETEDALLGTATIERFLYYALPTHFNELKPTIERMLSSDLTDVVEVGTRQACLASLDIEEARPFAERCLHGTETHRRAAAEIFVANLRSAHFRTFCEEALVRLFHDSSKNVRDEAAKCFFHFEGEELGSYTTLVNGLVRSPAFTDGFQELIWALEKTTAKLPEVTYSVCDRFVKELEAQSNVKLFRSGSVSQLLVRVYSQSKKADFQSKCLDLMDRIMQQGAYGLDGVLAEYER